MSNSFILMGAMEPAKGNSSLAVCTEEESISMGRRNGSDIDLELFELLVEIDALDDPGDVPLLLGKLLNSYGLRSVAYLGSGVTACPEKGPYLAVTYTSKWVEHYKAQRFADIDPAVQIGMRRMLPIDWRDFSREDEKVRRLFGEASEFGLGRHGISLPVHGCHGDRGLLSITSETADRDWQRLRLAYMRDFQVLALHIHQAILRLESNRVEPPALSPRERECLLWIAEGKTYWECAVILGLSEHTVRCYLESVRLKLGAANNTHAVNKAGKASLLSRLP